MLRDNFLCKELVLTLGYYPRTISREIKKHREIISNHKYGTYGKYDNTPFPTLNPFPYVCNGCV